MSNPDDQVDGASRFSSGPLADRRAALLKLLTATAGAYTVPLVASFSMGGLSVKAQGLVEVVGGNQPQGGNQCFGGNQSVIGGNQTFSPVVYRIELDARFTLGGLGPKGHVPILLLVRPDPSAAVVDADGWSSRALVEFYSKATGLITLSSIFTLIVSKLSATLTLLPTQFAPGNLVPVEVVPKDAVIRGGGPLTLSNRAISYLTPSPFGSKPIRRIGLTFSATMDAPTIGCGVLSIISVRPPATLQLVATSSPGLVPSGQVPSGELP